MPGLQPIHWPGVGVRLALGHLARGSGNLSPMCVSYPARVLSVEADAAFVELDGVRRRASLVLEPDVQPGDWVVVAAGTIIERLEEADAQEIMRLLDQAAATDQ
jgi:hydrogenase assembly chaperone HypC/HupF